MKGSRKARRLGGAERGGMYRMEMPRFNLVGIFLVQNQDCKVHRGTYQGMEKVKAAALREKIYSLVNELRLEGNLRSCSIHF